MQRIIIDNYPKWKQTHRLNKTSSLEDMVLLRNFQRLTLLVATTSGVVCHFREISVHHHHIKVKGITHRSVSTYIDNVFKTRKEFGSKVQGRILRGVRGFIPPPPLGLPS